MNKKISIIGGGVNGLTTALTLQLAGFETTIYAEHLVNDEAPRDPHFASLYPAASVIPHSINSDEVNLLFPVSLKVFSALKEQNFTALTMHRHFELFEHAVAPPSYTRFLHAFSDISDLNDEVIPRRNATTDVHGWVFDCFVAEWPVYMQQLYKLYQQAGGRITQNKIRRETIEQLPGDVIINCSGAGTMELFEGPAEHALIRGHLLRIKNMAPIVNERSQICSYNYTPDPSIYATPQGNHADVYFYPVNGKWILGGSRQPGTPGENGSWKGEQHADTISINDIEIPRQVIDLNNQILSNTFGLRIQPDQPDIDVNIGYRYTRKNAASGLRLESDEAFGKKIIHNYGHGGAGVTISWGCALQVLHLLDVSPVVPAGSGKSASESGLLKHLQLRLHEVYWNDFDSPDNKN